MYTSKAGERGMVNKVALRKKAESCGREYDGDYLVKSIASEAILRDWWWLLSNCSLRS